MINSQLLKGRIVAAGYTQKTLAKEMNMSENSMSSKINGESSFTLKEVWRLCELLHISAVREKCEIFLP